MSALQTSPAASSPQGHQPNTKHLAELDNLSDAIASLIRVSVLMIRSNSFFDRHQADPHTCNIDDRTQEIARIAKLEDRYDHEVKDRAACLKQIAHINQDVTILHERVMNICIRLNSTQEILNARGKTNGNDTKSPLEQPYPG